MSKQEILGIFFSILALSFILGSITYLFTKEEIKAYPIPEKEESAESRRIANPYVETNPCVIDPANTPDCGK